MEIYQEQLSDHIRLMSYLYEDDPFSAILDSIIRAMMIFELDRSTIKVILENSLGEDPEGNDLIIKQRILEY